MDDPDQTAPAPRDDGSVPPKRPTPREVRDMVTGNQRAAPPPTADKAKTKAIEVEDLNAANDK
jgi:hypothetical protein